MASPTLTVDRDGQILTWSKDAERLLGYSKLDAVGRSADEAPTMLASVGSWRLGAAIYRKS